MEKSDLVRRAEDLYDRCSRSGSVTFTPFLTPAEQYGLKNFPALFSGGFEEAERKIAFFLPDWMEPEDLDLSDYICAVKAKAYFGTPAHRDYLGAVLGLGLERSRIGDIIIKDDCAYIICTPSVQSTLVNELDKAGRITVKTEAVSLDSVPAPERKVKAVKFTVKSMRLDAVAGDMFSISRSAAAEAIRQGLVSLNYSVCEKTDAPVNAGDVLSIRGHGKGRITELGGETRKGRIFVSAELYL